MIQQINPPKPTGGRPKDEEYQFDLLAAYRVMIRSYLRRHPPRQSAARDKTDEVNHG